MSCEMCATKSEVGWWGRTDRTHCRTCHATWALGTKTTHCVTCHLTFSTPANCDRHQSGTKADPRWYCRPPESVGLVCDDNGAGTPVWHMPGGQERFKDARGSAANDVSATPGADDTRKGAN